MESESLEEEESHLIINAVKDANIPKFVAEDLPLFRSILADLFPGLDPPAPDNKLLKVISLCISHRTKIRAAWRCAPQLTLHHSL